MNCCFASDNTSGAHPKILQALADASHGWAESYGEDAYTKKAQDIFRELFGADSQTYFVYNGTGSNTLALGSMLRSYQAVLCSDVAHIAGDETGAPEKFTGCKIIPIPSEHGKIRPEQLSDYLGGLGSQHAVQPHVLSLSNVTELGTIYTCQEMAALCEAAHRHGLKVHLDGSRIANAAVSLGCGFAEMTRDCGVDALSFGATKNGMVFGEAVVFPHGCDEFSYLRKHGTQLHSKMRFLSAQMIAYLTNDLWVQNARHANHMAHLLCEGLRQVRGAEVVEPCQSNAVFVTFTPEVLSRVQSAYSFHDIHINGETVYRLMCGFDMPREVVEDFIARAKGE